MALPPSSARRMAADAAEDARCCPGGACRKRQLMPSTCDAGQTAFAKGFGAHGSILCNKGPSVARHAVSDHMKYNIVKELLCQMRQLLSESVL